MESHPRSGAKAADSVLFVLSDSSVPPSHTAATSPAGSPGSSGVTVESAPSEPSTEVAGTPPEEQTTRYVDRWAVVWICRGHLCQRVNVWTQYSVFTDQTTYRLHGLGCIVKFRFNWLNNEFISSSSTLCYNVFSLVPFLIKYNSLPLQKSEMVSYYTYINMLLLNIQPAHVTVQSLWPLCQSVQNVTPVLRSSYSVLDTSSTPLNRSSGGALI